MNKISELDEAENQIDSAFVSNALLTTPYQQAMWTILSVVEDIYLERSIFDQINDSELRVSDDNLLNEMTHSLRAILKLGKREEAALKRTLISEDYNNAKKWLQHSQDYAGFCIVFPWIRREKMDWRIDNNEIISNNWKEYDFRYEVYNSIFERDAEISEDDINYDLFNKSITKLFTRSGDRFELKLDRNSLGLLQKCFGNAFMKRFKLAGEWKFTHFSISEYSAIYSILKAIMFARRLIRIHLTIAPNSPANRYYSSSVWVTTKSSLASTLALHLPIKASYIERILDYITFGNEKIRNPDIAFQPIIDLGNGKIAISPHPIVSSNAERNLCALVNQIPKDKKIYLAFGKHKEQMLIKEIISEINKMGFEFKSQKIKTSEFETDIDLAIIDKVNKVCICIELKWFIEPAEPREIDEHAEEIEKGISQSIKKKELFSSQNKDFLDILNIDSTYEFHVAIGSVNWIGLSSSQCDIVPVIKVKHFIRKIIELNNLPDAIRWLNNREYLPKPNLDYRVHLNPNEFAGWKCNWYGFHILERR